MHIILLFISVLFILFISIANITISFLAHVRRFITHLVLRLVITNLVQLFPVIRGSSYNERRKKDLVHPLSMCDRFLLVNK